MNDDLSTEKQATDALAAWQQVYEGLSADDVSEVETLALDRAPFMPERDKPLSRQLMEDEAALLALRTDLDELERKYGLSSEEFMQRYQRGEMRDAADVFEWNALYKMHTRLADAVKSLRDQLI